MAMSFFLFRPLAFVRHPFRMTSESVFSVVSQRQMQQQLLAAASIQLVHEFHSHLGLFRLISFDCMPLFLANRSKIHNWSERTLLTYSKQKKRRKKRKRMKKTTLLHAWNCLALICCLLARIIIMHCDSSHLKQDSINTLTDLHRY